jgi:hypothetical protein
MSRAKLIRNIEARTDLSSKVRQRAIAGINRIHAAREAAYDERSNSLMSAFHWTRTQEGGDFWKAVNAGDDEGARRAMAEGVDGGKDAEAVEVSSPSVQPPPWEPPLVSVGRMVPRQPTGRYAAFERLFQPAGEEVEA